MNVIVRRSFSYFKYYMTTPVSILEDANYQDLLSLGNPINILIHLDLVINLLSRLAYHNLPFVSGRRDDLL